MDGSQSIAAGAALSAFSLDAQHDRLMRLDFPLDDGPEAILLPNRMTAREHLSPTPLRIISTRRKTWLRRI